MRRRSRYAPGNLPRPYHWSDDAACLGREPTLFFPPGVQEDPTRAETEQAKSVCVPCPVRGPCLAHALTRPETYGVWGGMDEEERADLLRDARRAAERERRKERERATAASA